MANPKESSDEGYDPKRGCFAKDNDDELLNFIPPFIHREQGVPFYGIRLPYSTYKTSINILNFLLISKRLISFGISYSETALCQWAWCDMSSLRPPAVEQMTSCPSV
jgi:hypothetical protein